MILWHLNGARLCGRHERPAERVLRGSLRTVHAGVSASETNRVAVIGVTESVTRITSFEVYSPWERGYIIRGYSLTGESPLSCTNGSKDTIF